MPLSNSLLYHFDGATARSLSLALRSWRRRGLRIEIIYNAWLLTQTGPLCIGIGFSRASSNLMLSWRRLLDSFCCRIVSSGLSLPLPAGSGHWHDHDYPFCSIVRQNALAILVSLELITITHNMQILDATLYQPYLSFVTSPPDIICFIPVQPERKD